MENTTMQQIQLWIKSRRVEIDGKDDLSNRTPQLIIG